MSSELENKILTDLLIKKVIEEKRAYEDSNRQLRIEIPDYYNQETYRKKKEIKTYNGYWYRKIYGWS